MATLIAPDSAQTRTFSEHVRATLGRLAYQTVTPQPERLWLAVEPATVRAAMRVLVQELGARYVISVGADRRAAGDGFEVMHHVAFDAEHLRVVLRVPLAAESPTVPSITPLIPGASWAELEMRDMLGIESAGHPEPRPLMLPDDFPLDVHPLRKDVPYNFQPPAAEPRPYPYKTPPPGSTVVQLGPFFPVLEEPSQWRLFVDGERVVGADYRGFYCHRGIEKLADQVLTYNEVVSLAERICGICGCVHSCSYCQSVEEAVGLEVPLRARVIRTVALELERVQSHLLWLGLACHIVGFDWGFMQAWRVREPLMALAEHLTGSRKHFGVNLVGGVRWDIARERQPRVYDALAEVEREALALVNALQADDALLARLRGVGVLTPAEVRAMGVVGPPARASGVAIDARRDHPYAAYPLMRFDVVVQDGCDVLARTLVRALEIFESVKILRQCLALLSDLPEGDLLAQVPPTLPADREGLGAVEAPRGEVFHYVRTGARNGPERWRVRAPSYQNLQAVPLMFKPGTTIADVPIALGSADPCFSCTERMEIVAGDGARRRLRESEWIALSRDDMARRRAARAEGPC